MNQMNPQNIAKGLAALGRGNDSMLMHVTPREVSGLQSLAMAAGGSLTINPDTGLPEAGFLDFIADYVVPTALTLSGNPHLAVAYSGGKTLVQTGDPLQALMSAGMQYGANQFGGSLMKTGTPPTTPLTQGIEVGKSLASGGAQAAGVTGAIGTQSGIAPNLVDDVAQSMVPNLTGGTTGIQALPGLPGGPAAFPGVNTLTPGTTPSLTDAFSQNLSNMGSGLKNLVAPGGIGKFTEAAGGVGPALFQTTSAVSPLISAAYAPPEQQESSFDLGPFTPFAEVRRQNLEMGYAEGGIAALNPMHGMFDARNGMPEYGEPKNEYKKGGYLDGPGDGMSDDIPATIEGKQPARLADGEFVVPADVVSHLGNGSTKAGAKRLYAMMAKVRKARTGNSKQGKQINPNKYMPA